MNLIDKLNTSYKYVCDNSQHVKINYEKVDELIKNTDFSKIKYWLGANPFGIMDMDINDILNFLLIYHTIGDYCFWGDPKWEINTIIGKQDGSYAMIYLILQRFRITQSFNMDYEEFKAFLQGNVEIPLLKERFACLKEMNAFLKKYDKPFSEIIKKMHEDSKLLEFLINNLPFFEDISSYNGHDVYFYKRAQLLTSDILHALEAKTDIPVDYSHLIGCADYKIPQVMRCYGMLEYDSNLASKVDSKIELPENTPEEIEIRASDLAIINYIYEKLGGKVSKMEINDFIWLLGQDKTQMTKPYHRTLTKHY